MAYTGKNVSTTLYDTYSQDDVDNGFVAKDGSGNVSITGNVGIGTSNPDSKLTVKDTITFLRDTTYHGEEPAAKIHVEQGVGWSDGSSLVFSNHGGDNADGGTYTERMRIVSNGSVLVGTTDSVTYDNNSDTSGDNGIAFQGFGKIEACRYAGLAAEFNRTGSNGAIIGFRRSGISVGNISVTSSSTAYNTSSDYRLKTDVQPMIGATERLKALKPVNFEWIGSGERVDGFIAHEAQEVVPEAVHGTKDEVDDEGEPVYQGIDQSKLVPLLTAALQEAIGRIETLEAKVATLEGVTP